MKAVKQIIKREEKKLQYLRNLFAILKCVMSTFHCEISLIECVFHFISVAHLHKMCQ